MANWRHLLTLGLMSLPAVLGRCLASNDYPKEGDMCSARDPEDYIAVVMDRVHLTVPGICSPNSGGHFSVNITFEDVSGGTRQLESKDTYDIEDDEAILLTFQFDARYKEIKPDSIFRIHEQMVNISSGIENWKDAKVKYVASSGTSICPHA